MPKRGRLVCFRSSSGEGEEESTSRGEEGRGCSPQAQTASSRPALNREVVRRLAFMPAPRVVGWKNGSMRLKPPPHRKGCPAEINSLPGDARETRLQTWTSHVLFVESLLGVGETLLSRLPGYREWE